MTHHIRDLLISLASHMAYMQGQLEAHHQYDDLEDYYWYRESVELRQKVTDALLDEMSDQASELALTAAAPVTTEMTAIASSSTSSTTGVDEQVGKLVNAASRTLTQSAQQACVDIEDSSGLLAERCDKVIQMPVDNLTVDALSAEPTPFKREENPSVP
jgi:hypothetical protein